MEQTTKDKIVAGVYAASGWGWEKPRAVRGAIIDHMPRGERYGSRHMPVDRVEDTVQSTEKAA